METAEIDELLRRYTAAENRIAANLVELDDHATYGLMTAGVLTGETGRRVTDVLARSGELWSGLDALRRTLDRARALRGSGRLGESERLELEAVLTRPSVLVGATATPLAERDLLGEGAVEQHLTIDELLARLRTVYEPLRDTVAAVDAVWRDVLPRLDSAETTLAELEAEVAELGVTEPTVSIAAAQVRELRRTVMDDPLSLAADAGAELDGAVAEAARQVGGLRQGHDELDADLARTEVLVATARTLRARAESSHAEATAKIQDPQGLVRVPAEAAVDELAHRAAALRRDTHRPWQHLRAELDDWLTRAERLVGQLQEAEQRNARPIASRDELRGLLSAYRAKAAAVGLIERADLSDLADEAHNELFTAPTDLDQAQRLVSELGLAIQSGR